MEGWFNLGRQRAFSLFRNGEYAESQQEMLNSVNGINIMLRQVLSLSEKERLAWQVRTLYYSDILEVLDPTNVFDFVLKWKGIVFESLMEDRSIVHATEDDKNGQKILDEIVKLRRQLSIVINSDNVSKNSECEHISHRIEELERSLAKLSTAFKNIRGKTGNITTTQVQLSLPKSTTLIEFIQFNDFKLSRGNQRSYAALLLTNQNAPILCKIPEAEAIDQAVGSGKASIAENNENMLSDSMKILAEKLWSPISKYLPPETKTLAISPDGALNFLSFATLPDADGRFLAEKYAIAYVGSGRDLASPTPKDHIKQIALFANPVFDQGALSSAPNSLAMRSAEMAEFGQIVLPQLPGTEAEGKSLVQEAEKEEWAATAYFGDKATEHQIRSIKNPGILHLATHGFYLNAFTQNDENTRGMKLVGLDQGKPVQNNGKGVDAMRASGIALTGAQATLKAWSQGKAPDPDNDGVLTAEEVAGLDLEGTWLVTLSACESGIGEVKSGEGVFGLRRAFMMAGAQNLLMTLWPVNDTTTADFMKDFYHRALPSGDAPRALAETQRDWLVKLRKEKGLLAAVRDAGPFIMTTMGSLPANATFSVQQKKTFLK